MSVAMWKKGLGLKKSVTPSNKHGLTNFSEAYTVELPNGDLIYVSQPRVDRVSIIGEIPLSVYGDGDLASDGPRQFEEVLKAASGEDSKVRKSKKASSFAQGLPKKGAIHVGMKVGHRKANIDISAQPLLGPNGKPVSWKLRMEWCPGKTGPDAIARLASLLAHHLHFQESGATEWFQAAKVTRIDIAVDIIGVERPSLFVRLIDQKKIQTYTHWSTGLQTSNHFQSMGKSGDAGLVCYDKVQEQLDKSKAKAKGEKALKYGNFAHQRVERRLTGIKNKDVRLADLAQQPNLLAGPIIRLMRDLPDGPTKVDQQVAAAASFWFGWNKLSGLLKDSQLDAWKVLKDVPDHDFWDTTQLWEHWPKAIERAGLHIGQGPSVTSKDHADA